MPTAVACKLNSILAYFLVTKYHQELVGNVSKVIFRGYSPPDSVQKVTLKIYHSTQLSKHSACLLQNNYMSFLSSFFSLYSSQKKNIIIYGNESNYELQKIHKIKEKLRHQLSYTIHHHSQCELSEIHINFFKKFPPSSDK